MRGWSLQILLGWRCCLWGELDFCKMPRWGLLACPSHKAVETISHLAVREGIWLFTSMFNPAATFFHWYFLPWSSWNDTGLMKTLSLLCFLNSQVDIHTSMVAIHFSTIDSWKQKACLQWSPCRATILSTLSLRLWFPRYSLLWLSFLRLKFPSELYMQVSGFPMRGQGDWYW